MARLSIVRGGAGAARRETTEEQASAAALEVGLARRAASGDPLAQRRVLEIAGPVMLGVVRTVLGASAGEVEDVAQEALIAFVDGLPSFRGECGLRHYGCRIAARIAVRWRKRERSMRERSRSAALEQRALVEGPPPAPAALAASRRKAILRALLDDLPEAQAETLVLRVVLGHSLPEVAAATGAPVNTVRSRIRLAKEALRRRIESDPAAAELVEVER